jgi:proteasome lid subunit RPN8/RPN11
MTTPYTVYIIAASPFAEKVVADRIYHDREEAERMVARWYPSHPTMRVWEAEITIHDTPNDTGANE